ncbi:MAG: radical SAM family heme chaperone HemW [Dehalococcoidia bacterium]
MDTGKPLRNAADPMPGSVHTIGLYIHIPFCETKCPYCDFNTYAGIENLIPGYLAALETEIERWGLLLSAPALDTVFFGGGTPSYVPSTGIASLTAAYGRAFNLESNAEVTLEANPDDVTNEKLAGWLEAGINRLSMGVQSFDDGLLAALGRRHTADDAVQAFKRLRAAGFDNASIDLMFGLPSQTLEHWEESLDRALELETDHLSLYGLQLEPGTPLEAAVRRGDVPEPDQDLAADMYLSAMERLEHAGYRHYEISNWAKPGRESLHNLTYWRNSAYLGVGPGAHSSLNGLRFANMKSPRGYVRAMASEPPKADGDPIEAMRLGGPVDFVEETTQDMAIGETMMMGLRLDYGVRDEEFRSRFGRGLSEVFPTQIRELTGVGLLESDAEGIRLTRQGRLLGNEVFQRFLSVD